MSEKQKDDVRFHTPLSEGSPLPDLDYPLDQEWLQEVYQSWLRQPKPTVKELFEIFLEAVEAVETNLREEETIFTEQVLLLKQRIAEDRDQDEFTRWFLHELREHIVGPVLEQAWSRIQRYRRKLTIARGDVQQRIGIGAEEIAAAKANPIESLLPIKRSSQTRAYAHCPFHDDRTPSFVIYKEQNTFHCFGCGAHGDSIDFTMRREGLSFGEAVKWLIGR